MLVNAFDPKAVVVAVPPSPAASGVVSAVREVMSLFAPECAGVYPSAVWK